MPKLSIITPTYNAERVIAGCLKSINEQTFTDYEHIIVDGLSNDNTIDIVNKHINPKLIICSEKDKGIYDAMNKGIQIAKGEYIYFLGADDSLYNSNTLDNIFTIAKNEDLIYGKIQINQTNITIGEQMNLYKLMYTNMPHQALIMKTSIIKKLGGFDLKYKVNADYNLEIKCFKDESITKLFIDECFACYNLDGFSKHHKDLAFEQDFTSLFDNYRWWAHIRRNYIKYRGILNEHKKTLLNSLNKLIK